MEEKTSFSSRVLTPYYDNLPNGKKGCFFYVAEKDCVCLLDTPYRKGDSVENAPRLHASELEAAKNPECQVAWGFPAYLFALSMFSDIKTHEAEIYFHNYIHEQASYIDTSLRISDILKDWCRSLWAITPFSKIEEPVFSFGVLENIARVVKTKFYNEDDYAFNHFCNDGFYKFVRDNSSPVYNAIFLSTDIDDVSSNSMFPKVVVTSSFEIEDVLNRFEKHGGTVVGLAAILLNYAFKQPEIAFWRDINFINYDVINKILSNRGEYVIHKIRELRFDLPCSYEELFNKYLEQIIPPIQKVIKQDPIFPMELSEGNNIYSYIYFLENYSYQIFSAGDFYASFTQKQRLFLDSYHRRFLQYLSKNYGANIEFMNNLNLQEYGQVEPISISLETHMHVTDKDGNDVTLERARMSGWQMPQSADASKPQDLVPAFIINPKYASEIMEKIRSLTENKRGKDRVMGTRAAIDAGVIRRPTHTEFCEAFPGIDIPKSSFNNYTNPDNEPYYGKAYMELISDFRQYK